MRKSLLSLVLFFLLACSGALNSMTPALPFNLPAQANTTNIQLNTTNGVTTTEVSFSVAGGDAETVLSNVEKDLTGDGWTVASTWDAGTETGVLTGTKGTQTMSVTTSQAGSDAQLQVNWVH